jgi:branched-chain amino acid transport system permease protein
LTVLWAGLAVGSIYALAALSYNVAFIASGIFNFAQAQFIMAGTFVAYVAGAKLHLGLAWAIIGGAAVCAILAGLEEVLAIRPLAGKGRSGELVTTIGVAIFLDGLAEVLFGTDPRQVPYIQGSAITLLGGNITPDELTLILIAVLLTVLITVLSARTSLGLRGLAAAENRQAAMIRGINVRYLSLGAFAMAGAIAGGLGPFVGSATFAIYNLGDNLALKAFVALALGGFGSFPGALIGGLAVGVVEAEVGVYLGSYYQNAMVLALLLAVLLIRPTGLFGRPAERVV